MVAATLAAEVLKRVAALYAIGAPALDAEHVRDSVPLWFHTFALAPGIYTPGIARDPGTFGTVDPSNPNSGANCSWIVMLGTWK